MTIDIIIPTGEGGHKHLELCLLAVERFTRNDFKIIAVNNGSKSPETRKVLDEAKKRGATIVELASNRSFSGAINAGLAVSKGEYVCLLNDDVYVIDGWDAIMVGELADPSVGMVGALMPGGAAGLQGGSEVLGVVRVPYLVFAHVMMKRRVIDEVGLLDAETFDGYGSEDLDYSWRVREAGWKLKVSGARSLHIGGASMNRVMDRNSEYSRMHRKLVEKWTRQYVEKETRLYPRVALAVPTYNGKVDLDFYQSSMMLQKTGSFELELYQTKRLVVHYAREKIVEAILEADCFEYIWWLDDDMVFPPDTLVRLMAHQKPVVCALAYQRKEPHAACIFNWRALPANVQKTLPPEALTGTYDHMNDQEHTGLRKIDGCGSACTLMETAALRQLKDAGVYPLFSNTRMGEDL